MNKMEPRLDILMVDDDEIDLGLFRQAIDRTGLNISFQALTSGKDAIDYLEAKGYYRERASHPFPDVLVLDLKMPQLNGFDFLAWRKACGLFSAIPVAVLSGSKDSDEIQRALDLGATTHILKPETFDGWETVVRQIWELAGRRAAGATSCVQSPRVSV
jgi:CheY-like chemotaxis protein